MQITTWRFESFELDRAHRSLRQHGTPVAVTPKAFDVLALLVERHGQLVSKEEMLKTLWPDSYVEEGNLSVHISLLRKRLGDNAETHRFILTMPGRGYQFIAPVMEVSETPADAESQTARVAEGVAEAAAVQTEPVAASAAQNTPMPAGAAHTAATATGLAQTAAMAANAVLTGPVAAGAAQTGPVTASAAPTSGVAAGVTNAVFVETSLTQAARPAAGAKQTAPVAASAAQIAPVTASSAEAASMAASATQQAAAVGASVAQTAPVAVSVAEAAAVAASAAEAGAAQRPEIVWRRDESGRRAWRWWAPAAACALAAVAWTLSDRVYSRPASAVAHVASREVDAETQRLYQRGRYLLGKRTAQALRRGITYFEAALVRDPQFALAHSGLADAYGMLGYFGFAAPQEVLPRAQTAAARALALDPHSAAAHTSRAYILHRYEWRFDDAERSFVRAIELQPDYALARHWYASFLESMNRHGEAIVQSAKAEELEPISPVISANFAGILENAQHVSRAVVQWDKTLELDQAFWPVHQAMAELYANRDMPQQALDAFRRSVALTGDSPKQVAALARIHIASGRLADARRLLANLETRAATEWVSPADIASIYAVLGERDQAFMWLERAIEARDPLIAYLAESRYWRTLRRDARYATLLQRVGLDRVAIASVLIPTVI